jgi:hypothetical protein
MDEKQRTFRDVQVGKECICFDPKFSLHYTIPVIKKLPELTDESGNKYNAVFVSDGQVVWVDPDKLIVNVC